jgi:hypothetical protein
MNEQQTEWTGNRKSLRKPPAINFSSLKAKRDKHCMRIETPVTPT